MITCAARNPEGKRERRSYIQRALAVMLCCVLVMGLMPLPRAKATAAVGAIAASGAVESFGVLSGIGTLLLTAAGVDFNNGYLTLSDSLYYGSTSYDSGYELWKWVQETKAENQAMFDWFSAVHETVTEAGGFQAGQTFDVPAEVLEGARAWAVQHYDFSSGAITVNQYGMYSGDYSITFVRFPSDAVANSWAVPVAYGSIVSFPSSYTFTLNGKSYVYDFANSAYSVSVNSAITADGGFSTGAAPMWYLAQDTSGHKYLTVTTYEISSGKVVAGCGYNASSLSYKFLCVDSFLNTLSSTITGSDVLGVPVTEDQKVKVPDVPMTQVGAVTLPVVGALTREDVLVGTLDPDVPAESAVPTTAPAEGDKVGDIALEDVAAAQPSLSAVFVSKFPFCIPWDFVQAVKLLASSPKAPVIEFDPLAKLEPLFGGRSRGDTTVTLDMSDYEYLGGFCRWITTIMFCAALIGLTKKLIWTA